MFSRGRIERKHRSTARSASGIGKFIYSGKTKMRLIQRRRPLKWPSDGTSGHLSPRSKSGGIEVAMVHAVYLFSAAVGAAYAASAGTSEGGNILNLPIGLLVLGGGSMALLLAARNI
jgi:hypothetical protein